MLDTQVGTIVHGQSLVKLDGTRTVADAARAMADRRVGAVLVTSGDELAGIFTDRDMVDRIVAEGLDAGRMRLADYMTPDPVAITEHHTVGDAMQVMKDRRTRHVPLKREDEIVGIVSVRDLLRAVIDARDFERQRFDDLWEGIPV